MAGLPSLAECKPGIVPTGFCALVAIAEQQEKIGNVFLPDAVKDKNQVVEQRGRLVAISPVAFDFAAFGPDQVPPVGAAVIIAKLSGVAVDGADGRKYRLVQDRDILAVVEEA